MQTIEIEALQAENEALKKENEQLLERQTRIRDRIRDVKVLSRERGYNAQQALGTLDRMIGGMELEKTFI
ncbi:hypothetical protein [Staphylococcus aureus]|uniref:hypothetical protein n=1 Tax=Staphylococcus aureus TaxID=1280 RepID=UPI0020C160CC|nr:hypothetical protein [Staphylococcus aureus]